MYNADLWTQNGFEDTVTRALLTCFETKIRKTRGAGPNSLNRERLDIVRRAGIYIPGNDRLVIGGEDLKGGDDGWGFDMVNDTLPKSGCLGMSIDLMSPEARSGNQYTGFFRAIYVRQKTELSPHWHRRGHGQLYEMFYMTSEADHVEGERFYFTVSKAGIIKACTVRVGNRELEDQQLLEVERCASAALQYLADRRFTWTIEAREGIALTHLGCVQEQIKSLLYARSLPLTPTGRLRPILHLVEAHNRRLKNGTDIEIGDYLRGIHTVEIGSTQFTVKPALNTLNTLPKGV